MLLSSEFMCKKIVAMDFDSNKKTWNLTVVIANACYTATSSRLKGEAFIKKKKIQFEYKFDWIFLFSLFLQIN